MAAYLTSLGAFFPGPPIDNDEMEAYLGRIGGKPSRARARVLKQNGIRTRHYALDRAQRALYRNSELAALAVRDALDKGQLPLEQVDFLAAATSLGDLVVPGFASMVHGELKNPACEVATLGGVCASGVMALKAAHNRVLTEPTRLAVACASELPSRMFKASRFERQLAEHGELPFDTEFLRWMLSDGAGAAVLQSSPRPDGLSLQLEFIELKSYAHQNPVCMYGGTTRNADGTLGPSWQDYPDVAAASLAGAFDLRQDIRLLDRLVETSVDGFFELVERGRVAPDAVDWVVCHYSSHHFKEPSQRLLAAGGVRWPEERWFTNLYTRGNVGSASLYVMLEELWSSGRLQPGQRIFCMVPESGRFITAYLSLRVVGPSGEGESEPTTPRRPVRAVEPLPPAGPPELRLGADPLAASLVRRLTRAWIDFEAKLREVPLVARLEGGRFSLEDYRLLLLNLRQQVVDGGRWIARAASSIDDSFSPLRSLFLEHARDEHRDFELLERDYVSVGGALEAIQHAEKNVGSEALSAWMFHRAGQPNPFDLFGAMFIIEGLGNRLAKRWGQLVREQLSLEERQVSFLLYHGANDVRHFERLEAALTSGVLTPELADRIVKTAQVTARLYRLQLEELAQPGAAAP